MKTAVIYFSLTGNTGRLAEMLDVGDTDLIRLKRRHGLLSLLGLGSAPKVDSIGYDLFIAGCPVWGEAPAPPLMKVLKKMDFGGKQVNAYVTYGVRAGKSLDRIMEEVERRNGMPGRRMAFNMSKEISEDEVRKLLSF